MRAPGASLRVFWRFFDKIWSRNDPEKLETVPKREKCKLSSEQRVWGNSIGVWRLYLAPKMSNFQKTTNFFGKKTLREATPLKKWFKGWEFFYEDSNIWLTYVQKRILRFTFREKLCNFKKRLHRRARGARLLKTRSPGYFNPWGCIF